MKNKVSLAYVQASSSIIFMSSNDLVLVLSAKCAIYGGHLMKEGGSIDKNYI